MAEGKGENQSKIRYEQIADMGSTLPLLQEFCCVHKRTGHQCSHHEE